MRRSLLLLVVGTLSALVGACGSGGSDDGGGSADVGTEATRAASGTDRPSGDDFGFGVHAELERRQAPCPGEAAATEIEAEGAGTLEGLCVFVTRAGLTIDDVDRASAAEGARGWTVTVTFADGAQTALDELAAANPGVAFVVVAEGRAWGGQSPGFMQEGTIEVSGLDEEGARHLADVISAAAD